MDSFQRPMNLSRKELSDAFEAANAAREPIEKQPEPEPFVSRFERSGERSYDKLDHIRPDFNEVSEGLKESKEKPAEPEPFVSRFERIGDRSYDKLNNITPEFRQAASGTDEPSKDAQNSGHGSEMIEKDKPSPELKPAPEDRKTIDRKAHLDEMAKDDKAAKASNVTDLADQIAERQAMQAERNQEMGFER